MLDGSTLIFLRAIDWPLLKPESSRLMHKLFSKVNENRRPCFVLFKSWRGDQKRPQCTFQWCSIASFSPGPFHTCTTGGWTDRKDQWLHQPSNLEQWIVRAEACFLPQSTTLSRLSSYFNLERWGVCRVLGLSETPVAKYSELFQTPFKSELGFMHPVDWVSRDEVQWQKRRGYHFCFLPFLLCGKVPTKFRDV